ncbi:MAG: ABC transporter ATP-binding protein [Oligoflexales bacterium]
MTESKKTPNLEAVNLSVIKGSKQIFSGLNLRLEPGKVIAVIGPNGTGKTSLLRSLAGLDRSTLHSVVLGGRPLFSYSERERSTLMSWLPAHHDIYLPIKAMELVVWGRYPLHQGLPSKIDIEAAEAALTQTGALGLGSRNIASLSSGERQKVFLARALAGRAAVYLADEPCSHLDTGAGIKTMRIFNGLASSGNLVCVSLHDLTLIRNFTQEFVAISPTRPPIHGPISNLSLSMIEDLYEIRGLKNI